MSEQPKPGSIQQLMDTMNGLVPRQVILCHPLDEQRVTQAINSLFTFRRTQIRTADHMDRGTIYIMQIDKLASEE